MAEQDTRITRINIRLMNQKANMASMKLFKDDAQDNGLAFRGKIIKNNYKYIRKMDKADEMIKMAHQINLEMLDNNKKIIKRQEKRDGVNTTINKIAQSQEISATIEKEQPTRNQDKAPSIEQRSPEPQASTINIELISPQPVSNVQNSIQNVEQQPPSQLKELQVNHTLHCVDYLKVQKYFSEKMSEISKQTSAEQVYRIFSPFYEICGLQIDTPLIKKYKNCLYFGEQNKKPGSSYEGFLIFNEDNKIFYGQLINQKKHGRGVELDFKNNAIYIGNFTEGKKNGQFTVIRAQQRYTGQLKKGLYHGYGQLTTQFSVYKGMFEEGMRNGRGQEQFHSGLAIEGEFYKNKFTNLIREDPQKSNTIATSSKKVEASIQYFKSSEIRQTLGKVSNSSVNPESIYTDVKCKANVIFDPSPPKNQNYQEYNYGFDQGQDLALTFAPRKVKHSSSFRIKESPKTTKTKRQTTANWQPLSNRV